MICWSLTIPGCATPGQRTIAGMRSPPSSSSVLRPLNGQTFEKRSPPLSLVKTTTVSCSRPSSASLARIRPICRSMKVTISA
jgi:hypothetical protein